MVKSWEGVQVNLTLKALCITLASMQGSVMKMVREFLI